MDCRSPRQLGNGVAELDAEVPPGIQATPRLRFASLFSHFQWASSASQPSQGLYPHYTTTAAVLAEMGVLEDFRADGPVRFTHRVTDNKDIYFIANTSEAKVETTCRFRGKSGAPQLWDPVTSTIRRLPQFTRDELTTSVPMTFEPRQSFFVVFPRGDSLKKENAATEMVNFPKAKPISTLEGSWEVSFDPKWGGPRKVTFDKLQDWTRREAPGIKFYSGIATYRKDFNYSASPKLDAAIYLELGTVHDIARVRLNEKDLGVVWCAPWRVEISNALQPGDNQLEIEVANRWPNRLFGDQQAPDKDARTVKWESGFLGGREYKTGRYTFATTSGPNKLLPSGLLGPVRLLAATLTE